MTEEKTRIQVLTEDTVRFCKMMAVEMGEDPEVEEVWKKYMPMATDFFLMDAFARVRNKFWDEEKAKETRLLLEQNK